MRHLWLLVLFACDAPHPPRAASARAPLRVDGGGAGEPRAAAPVEPGIACAEPELDRLLAQLQDEEQRENVQLRAAARDRLARLVTLEVAAGAIESMMKKGGDHERAQLLLALAPDAPGLERLLAAPDPLVRLYARLRLDGPIEPERIHDPGLFRPGTGFEPLPVSQIYRRICVEKKNRTWKKEFEQDYEREFLPLLRKIDKQLPARRRIRVDLDGDGEDELFLDGTHVWKTHWYHDEGFLAVIGSDGGVDWLQKLEEKSERVVVTDVNRDGKAEVYVWLVLGGYGARGLLGCHAGGAGYLRTGHHWHEIGIADGPLFYSTSHYLQSNVGTWGIEAGVLARKLELYEWRDGFRPAGRLYLPLEAG